MDRPIHSNRSSPAQCLGPTVVHARFWNAECTIWNTIASIRNTIPKCQMQYAASKRQYQGHIDSAHNHQHPDNRSHSRAAKARWGRRLQRADPRSRFQSRSPTHSGQELCSNFYPQSEPNPSPYVCPFHSQEYYPGFALTAEASQMWLRDPPPPGDSSDCL